MSKLDWFAALHEGNCVTINVLLDGGNELLYVCPDEPEAERMESGWKGCNAMHVAVKQGCSQLVRRIIEESGDSSMNPKTLPPYKSLGDMILAVEGNCKLDTIAIALLNGDRVVTWLLAEALLVKCRSNPYGIELGSGCPVPSAIDEDKLQRIRHITMKVLEEIGNGADRVVLYYNQQCEFNFLPMDEYLFLALCKVGARSEPGTLDADMEYLSRCRLDIVVKTLQDDGLELLMFLFELKDGRGRTALHVGIDHHTIGYLYRLLQTALGDGFATAETTHLLAKRLANATDRAGRTPLHRAAAAVDFPVALVRTLVDFGVEIDSSFEFKTEAVDCFVDVKKVSARNGFGSWFPLVDSKSLPPSYQESLPPSYQESLPPSYQESLPLDPSSPQESISLEPLSLEPLSPKTSLILEPPSHQESLFSDGFLFPLSTLSDLKTELNLTPLQSLPITVIHLAIFNPFIEKEFLIMILTAIRDKERVVTLNKLKVSLLPFVPFDLTDFSFEDGGLRRPPSFEVSRMHRLVWITPWSKFIVPACASLGLAALVGNIDLVRLMLWYDDYLRGISENEISEDGGKIKVEVKDGIPGLLLAAAVGDSRMVQTILNSDKFDHKGLIHPDSVPSIPLTALHAAVRGWPQLDDIGKNLLHVVNFRDGWCKKVKDFQGDEESNRYSRQACVNLLLQNGASVWDTFGRQDAPKPGPGTSSEFRAWWSERVERETEEMKTSLTTAANAISVTAALVATASFIGPLQPPMGYGMDETVHVEKLAVKFFIIFDTLAFYMALSAVVLAMIPSLPMPTESVKSEGKRARKSVLFAVTLLVISLLCILLAFAAASIAIIPNDESWNQGGVTFSTVAAGAPICVLTIIWFVRRLWRLVRSLVITPSDPYTTVLGFVLFSFFEALEYRLYNLVLCLEKTSLPLVLVWLITTPSEALYKLSQTIFSKLRTYVKKNL